MDQSYKDKFERPFKYVYKNIDGVDCPICQDPESKNKICIKTECGHDFHKNCLDKYIKTRNTTCPLCRTEMFIVFPRKPSFYILILPEYPNRYILTYRNYFWHLYHYMNDRLISKIIYEGINITHWIDMICPSHYHVHIVKEEGLKKTVLKTFDKLDWRIIDSFPGITAINIYDEFAFTL